QHFHEHADSIAHGMDARVSAVRPLHGHFLDFHSKLAGEKENFGVKSPAFDALQRENGVGSAAREGFESALRVVVGKAENKAQGKVEDASQELAMQGLALGLQFGT